VTPGPSFIGNVSLHYTVEDKTTDVNRDVTGEILITVWDAPDQPAAPTISGFGDGSVTTRFNTPTSDNGSPITSYTVRSSPASTAPTCTAGADCTFTGLTNGTSYTFYVSATNGVGTSQESPASASVTPYRAPSVPNGANLSASGYAPATLNMNWGASADTGGGDITYHWALSGSTSQSGTTTGTSASFGGAGAGSYSFTVYASNPGGNSGTISSNTVTVSNPQAHYWVTRSGDTLTYNWANQIGNPYPQVSLFRAYTRSTNPISDGGPWATYGCGSEVSGTLAASSGSISITCPGATDSYSVEPYKYGPWLQVGTDFYLSQ
jgi:hypothetical protein